MRINNKDKALDLLFAQPKEEKCPVTQAETVKLLQSKNTAGFKRFFNQKTILMMTSVFVTFSLLIYLLNPVEKVNLNSNNNLENKENEIIKHFPGNDNMEIEKSAEKIIARKNQHVSTFEKIIIPYVDSAKNALDNNSINKTEVVLQNYSENNPSGIQLKDIQTITPPKLKLIELPEEILNKLNISFSRDGICITIPNLISCYSMDGSTHEWPKDYLTGKPKKQEDGSYSAQVNPKYLKMRDSLRILSPVLITDDEGKYWRATHFSDAMAKEFSEKYPGIHDRNISDEERQKAQMEFMSAELNNFVPILVRLPEKYRKNRVPRKDEWRQDVIMWFQPTEAFLAVLSDTLRTKIILENPSISTINSVTLNQQNTIKNNELSLYPNPVIDKATINFNLDKPKKVNIALHDVSGKLIKIFVRNETRSAGNNSIEVDLKDLIQGVYILSIETADGNILTQRVIKQ